MSKDIIQLNPEAFQCELKDLVKNSIEETLNAMLDEEAKNLVNAERYEREEGRTGYRAGHYDRKFTTTAGELSKTRCVNGHYVCNECHTKGIDSIFGLCFSEKSKNPVEIINKMMALPFCHMHGPEHHIMVGAALLTAYRNAGGDIDLPKALTEMKNRGQSVPGGACGFWGACGAGISSGMFVSIISGSTPLAGAPWGLSNRMTAKSLEAIGSVGGPRCCKRDSYLSILAAVDFVKEYFGVEMEKPEVICNFSSKNNQCIGVRCPFSKAHR